MGDVGFATYQSELHEALSHVVHVGECRRIQEKRALGYVGWHEMSDALAKSGQQQLKCETCVLWQWPHERCAIFTPAGSSLDS